MTEILHADGFLGTSANFAADMTLTLSILVGLIFTLGMVMALKGRYELHRWLQTGGALLNLILVLWMMILPFRDFVLRDFSQPVRPPYFYGVTTLHALIGLAALVFGSFVVLRGHNLMIKPLKFRNYKPYMRTAYILYMAATLLGLGVYLTWFVLIPNPPLFK
ncbi:MAG: hypothetical protein AB1801_11015 [Chloroflexota bacterium]